MAQFAAESARQRLILDALKGSQALPLTLKLLIGLDVIRFGEELVEQCQVPSGQANTRFGIFPQFEQVTVAFDPLIGNDADRAIRQAHIVLAAANSAAHLLSDASRSPKRTTASRSNQSMPELTRNEICG
jgi:hypothetical protein